MTPAEHKPPLPPHDLDELALRLMLGTWQTGDKLLFDTPAGFERDLARWLVALTKRPGGRFSYQQWWLGLNSLWFLNCPENTKDRPEKAAP